MAATTTWLHALAVCPAPIGPRWRTVAPTRESTGHTRATASSAPPTITLSAPDSAPATPPLEQGRRRGRPRPRRAVPRGRRPRRARRCRAQQARAAPRRRGPACRAGRSSPGSRSSSMGGGLVSTVRVTGAAASAGTRGHPGTGPGETGRLRRPSGSTRSAIPSTASKRRAMGSPIRPSPEQQTPPERSSVEVVEVGGEQGRVDILEQGRGLEPEQDRRAGPASTGRPGPTRASGADVGRRAPERLVGVLAQVRARRGDEESPGRRGSRGSGRRTVAAAASRTSR